MDKRTLLLFFDSLRIDKAAYLKREESWRLLVVSFLRDLAFYQLHKIVDFSVKVYSPSVRFHLTFDFGVTFAKKPLRYTSSRIL